MRIFLRAVQTALRRCSAGAPGKSRIGAVSFIQRFGATLNHHVHFHVIVSDGVFSQDDDREISFHPAHGLTREIIKSVEQQVRPRILRYFTRRGLLKEWAAREMLEWNHAGGFSLDASVHIPDWDRQGLERLVRYCARPPVNDTFVQNQRKTPPPPTWGRTLRVADRGGLKKDLVQKSAFAHNWVRNSLQG